MASEQERFLTGAIEAWMGEPDAIPKLVTTNYRLHAEKYEAMADNARLQALLAERDAEVARLVDALEAANGVMWMAEAYAEGGGSRGPEMRDYREAEELVSAALAARGGEGVAT